MKHVVVVSILLIAGFVTLAKADSYPMAVGPYVNLKLGVDAGTIPSGYKTGAVFNGIPDFGASFYLPFSKTQSVGVSLDLGYHTYAYGFKPNDNATDANTFTYKYHYFAISPNFCANVLVLGFTFGLPTGYDGSNTAGNITQTYTTDNMSTLIDVHVGVIVPLLNDKTGRLNFNFVASYVLSGMYKSTTGQVIDYNPQVASASLGFSYLFNVSGQ